MRNRPLSLSPSFYHKHLMDCTEPALSYRGGDVLTWQSQLRPKVSALVGLDAPGERTPLNVRTLWRRDHPLGTIEKIVFTAERAADVPAYVCLPKNVRPPYTFMICLQGHSTGMHVSIGVQRGDERRALRSEGDRDFAIGCMQRGIAALCIEQRAFGERRETLHQQRAPHPCHDAAMHALMLGRTLLGERIFDVDRGIDYLLQRGDADPARIGVMGNSGGGVVSIYAAALLPRLSFAIPSCSFCTLRHSFMSIYHCADNYVPGLLKVAEMADVMGLFAPKPVVIVAGRIDPIFPLAGVRAAFRDLKAIYRAAGAPQACRLVVGPQGHRFYADAAWAKLLPLLRRAHTAV